MRARAQLNAMEAARVAGVMALKMLAAPTPGMTRGTTRAPATIPAAPASRPTMSASMRNT